MGQEKWATNNHTEVQSSLKKVMLYVLWDLKGILYYDHFLENQPINSNKYCSLLHQMKGALSEKRPELVYRKHTLPSRQDKNTCFFDE